jgi:hypothetical protein
MSGGRGRDDPASGMESSYLTPITRPMNWKAIPDKGSTLEAFCIQFALIDSTTRVAKPPVRDLRLLFRLVICFWFLRFGRFRLSKHDGCLSRVERGSRRRPKTEFGLIPPVCD